MTKTSLLLCLAAACGAPCGSAPTDPGTWYDSGTPVAKVVARTVSPNELGDLTWRTGADVPFRATTLTEREGFATLVPELLAAVRSPSPGDPGRFAARLHDVGFRLETWTSGTTQVWAVLEEQSRRRGAGAYLFRVGPPEKQEVLLQAPHADYDMGTGDMAARLFLQPPPGNAPRALFLNTMHRYQLLPGQKERRAGSPADVAHNPDHLYTAATDAALGAGPLLVVQLHGFGTRSDDDADGALPEGTVMVVSAGLSSTSTPRQAAIADKLKKIFGDGVRRYPEEAYVLGATTNVQGRAARRRDGGDFVHLEISAPLRKQLREGGPKLNELGAVLFNTSETP
jgi:hypothetical protein